VGDVGKCGEMRQLFFSKTPVLYVKCYNSKEVWEMWGDEVCSPTPGACTLIVYYSHSPDILIYQITMFLHVYIQLWPLKKNFTLEKPLRACAHVIDINIKLPCGREEEIGEHCQGIYFSCSR